MTEKFVYFLFLTFAFVAPGDRFKEVKEFKHHVVSEVARFP